MATLGAEVAGGGGCKRNTQFVVTGRKLLSERGWGLEITEQNFKNSVSTSQKTQHCHGTTTRLMLPRDTVDKYT
jgi:hypothetical protein